MLRALVSVLLVANLLFFGWSQGWLDGIVGVRATGDREPERLTRQVRPERVVVLPRPTQVAIVEPSCLEAGPFLPHEATQAEAVLQGVLPVGGWSNLRQEKPGTWLVYMGSYPDRETMLRKIQEIGRARTDFEEVAVPGEGEFGLAIGRYDDRASAERGLVQAQLRGIRTARVLQLSPPSVMHMLRVEKADTGAATRLKSLSFEPRGRGFVSCGSGDGSR